MLLPPNPSETNKIKWAVSVTVAVIQYLTLGVAMYLVPMYIKEDMYTSSHTGRVWLNELLLGHDHRFHVAFGMRRHVFLALVLQIRCLGYLEAENATIFLEESLAIFLYTCVTGLAIDHVAERFQHSKSTISEYGSLCYFGKKLIWLIRHFRIILNILSDERFYNKYVHLPNVNDPVPEAIQNNPKWWPFFQNVLGAIDGTHINCTPSAQDVHSARNRKGGVTQNCLAVVSFQMRFLLFISGWDGCAADATMYAKARLSDFRIPPGKCYLADAGFGICNALLVPYRGVRYHLAEWGRANQR